MRSQATSNNMSVYNNYFSQHLAPAVLHRAGSKQMNCLRLSPGMTVAATKGYRRNPISVPTWNWYSNHMLSWINFHHAYSAWYRFSQYPPAVPSSCQHRRKLSFKCLLCSFTRSLPLKPSAFKISEKIIPLFSFLSYLGHWLCAYTLY